MVACTITLATGFTVALRNDINLLRKDFEDLTTTKTKLIGEYCISTLVSHDKDGCLKNLHTGVEFLEYNSIEVYDENGDLFTKIGDVETKIPSHIRLTVDSVEYTDVQHEIKFSHVINHDGYKYGYIILHASTLTLENEIQRDIKVLFFAAMVIIFIGGILIFYAQKAISEPIFRLTKYLGHVAENANTSKSIHVRRKDEIGSIYQAINKLLKTIQKNADERDAFYATLQKNNEKLGRTLDAFSDGHWEYDLRSQTWFFSDAWLNTFGYKREGFDFDNSFWEKIIHPDDFENYQKTLNAHLNNQLEYFDVEFRILGKKGGYRWVHFKGHWVEKEDEKVTDMLGITIDIQDSRNKLEHIKATNERQINESKLNALAGMVAGVSHSLKNFLSPVYGYADFGLMTVKDNDQLKDELEIIKRSAKNANNIIEDMLAFAGVNNYTKTRIDILKIITDIIPEIKLDQRKNIEFTIKTSLTKATIMGDHFKIQNAFTHILKNAQQASFENENVNIEIDYLQIDSDNLIFYGNIEQGEYISVKITDTGVGIEEENIDKIFEPFYTTKEIGQGIGLGLSVTKGIINSHGGQIYVKSEQYKETTFHILLPSI